MTRTRALLTCGLLLAGRVAAQVSPAPQPVPSAAPLPTFTAEVEQVVVDVVVTDKQGLPVTGLSKSDFSVEEDGAPQSVATFEAVQLAPATPAAESAPPPSVARPSPSAPARQHKLF